MIKFTIVDTYGYLSPVSTDIIDTVEEVGSTKKTFYLVPKNMKFWRYVSWIYTAGYILQVLKRERVTYEYCGTVLLKYNYGHLVIDGFIAEISPLSPPFLPSLEKSIYWNLNFEIYSQFSSTSFSLKNSKNKINI